MAVSKNFIIDFLTAFYEDNNIPVYLFQQDRLLFSCPEQETFCYPPKTHADSLRSSIAAGCDIKSFSTPSGAVWGGFCAADSSYFIILGPGFSYSRSRFGDA